MLEIKSRDNNNLKLVRKLHDKKYRDQEGLFIIEGKRSFLEAIKKTDLIYSIYISQEKETEYRDYYLKYPHINFYLIDAQLMTYISTTAAPQGVLLVMKKPAIPTVEAIQDKRFLVYLDHINDPGNLGTIIRSCWALDVDMLLLSPGCADPYNPKSVRSSMGGIINLPITLDITSSYLQTMLKNGHRLVVTDLSQGINYYKFDYTQKSILVIGNEAWGVSDEIKKISTDYIKIPMNSRADSLNAASACAIIIAEAWKQRFDI
jgi:TrmH family RNA methyltransferase